MEHERGISFGGGFKWFHEERYRRELGITQQGFRRFCRQIGCPAIRIGKERLICLATWKICMWLISRPGNRDFLVPGCSTLQRNEGWQGVQEVEMPSPKDLEAIVKEAIAVAELDGVRLEEDTKKVTMEAARRVIEAHALFKSPKAHKYVMEQMSA